MPVARLISSIVYSIPISCHFRFLVETTVNCVVVKQTCFGHGNTLSRNQSTTYISACTEKVSQRLSFVNRDFLRWHGTHARKNGTNLCLVFD